MGEIYIEENHAYQIDLRKADWSVELHAIYRAAHLDLADVDYICERDGKILLIEYKNAKLAFENGFRAASQFNPYRDDKVANIARKFFDSFFYLAAHQRKRPVRYVYILEWPKGDAFARKMLREKIAKLLPFRLQMQENIKPLIIDDFQVMSIDEWNRAYKDMPISRYVPEK
ncbi:hypothetical protein [uncultured Mitsuokella sp.]|jgi:hypothetical protein|uniref:hypothetical protein n=1 Tax=uncultured Mitsuokella sp. TaxID=453120 RepID=UPI00266EFB45|nr:hypothetical protein [uncultured Mitsuokella sp.]